MGLIAGFFPRNLTFRKMAAAWEEVAVVAHEKRHELVLSGPEVSKRIDSEGFDKKVYSLVSLNFLELSKIVAILLGYTLVCPEAGYELQATLSIFELPLDRRRP